MAKKRIKILTEVDKTNLESSINKKADKATVDSQLEQKADKSYVSTELNKKANTTDVTSQLGKKVDKESGKGLSTNDFTDIQKNKVDTEFPASIKKLQEDVAAAGKVDTVNSVKPDSKKNIELTGSNIKYKTGASENIGVKIDILNGAGATKEKANKVDLESHKADKIHQGEVHGIKFNERGKLEVWNGVEWIELKGGGLPVNITKNIQVTRENDKRVELVWQDPDDIVINGETIVKWKSTAIVRKQGSMPKDNEDGILVGMNSIKNQYKNTPFVDTNGLENNKEYYYGIFPQSEDEIFTISEKEIVSATPTESFMYGFEVDETNLNPKTAVTYINSNVGFTPVTVSNGKVNYGSWEDFIKKISYRVMVKNGVEQYKVQYDNPAKKLDGSNAILTGADGDLFTKFIPIWRKYTKTTKGYKIELSDKPFTGAKSLVTELENGYNQFNNPVMILLQDLYLLLFKNRDSQTALGRGYVDSNDNFINTGGSNGKGYVYGATTGKLQMCFLGIEDLWGNKFQWVDGLVSDSSYNILTGTKSFNGTGSGYTKFTTGVTENLYGYAKTVQGGDCGYILADKAGSTSTGYCDYGDLGSGKVAYFGGNRSNGSDAGAFHVGLITSASRSYAYVGSRLCFKNENGVYIGNYLGYEQSGKLRSVAGKEPTGSKTIGAFRPLAQANN